MPSLLVWFSLLALCCLFRSPSRRFDRLLRTPHPVLQDFRLPSTLSSSTNSLRIAWEFHLTMQGTHPSE
jgi:hypothetical protein